MQKISQNGIEAIDELPRLLEAPFEQLEAYLDEPRLALDFPSFADGRGFSAAKRLRQLGYRGELLAAGHLIVDQWALLCECGFDAVVLSEERLQASGAEHWQAALRARQWAYQYDSPTLNSVWQARFSAVSRQAVNGH